MTETREEDAEGRGGKKREQGGRSFREDSHAHHYLNIRPHVGDDALELPTALFRLFQSMSLHEGRLSDAVEVCHDDISIHVPT